MIKKIDTLVFDVDDTLYSKKLGICKSGWQRLEDLFSNGLSHEFGIGDLSFADYQTGGDELLRNKKSCDWDALMEYICRQDVSIIPFNAELKSILQSLEHNKILYTNADYRHLERVLNQMDIANVFDNKFTPFDCGFYFKPDIKSFEAFFKKMNINPKTSAFFEDSTKNLEAAKKLGMTTILISEEKVEKPEFCDFVFEDVVCALKMFEAV